MNKKHELKKIGLAMETGRTRRHPGKLSGIGLQFFAAPSTSHWLEDWMAEIDARLAAIPAELEKDGADLDALEQEVRNLTLRREQLKESAERRAAFLKEIATGTSGQVVRTFQAGMQEQRTFGVDTPEYRSAWLKNLQGKPLDAEERVAVTASAAIPTQTMNQIIHRLELTPMIAAVDVTYIPGNVTFPIEGTVNAASWVAMGSAATDSGDTITSITLGAYKLIKTVEITADVMAMGIDAFESWLVGRLANKLSVAVDAAIFTGTGSSQATGLLKSGEITQTGTFTKAAMTYKDLLAIIATLPTQYLANASFAMPRALFYKEVLGITDTNGNPVVVADPQAPARFTIFGYPVIVDDNCTADKLLFGDFKEAYKFNFAQSPAVESDRSVAFRSGSTVYRVMALADGKPAEKKAVCLFTRATA